MGFYYEMLRVFLRILRDQVDAAVLSNLENDLITWRDRNAAQFEGTDKSEASGESRNSLVLRPEQVRFLFSS